VTEKLDSTVILCLKNEGKFSDCFTPFHFVRNDAPMLAFRHCDPDISGEAIC
jgi:hypothetical protein